MSHANSDSPQWSGETLLIKPTAIKLIVKEKGKRTSKEFLKALNCHVNKLVNSAVTEHNGGKKTLDLEVAVFVGCKI